MDEHIIQALEEIKNDLKDLRKDFNDLFRDGPITNLDKRVTVVEGKMKAVIGAGLFFGVPVAGYVAVEVFKHIFGG